MYPGTVNVVFNRLYLLQQLMCHATVTESCNGIYPATVTVLYNSTSELHHLMGPATLKIDQETWLCRTNLDYFVDKNSTILDHIRT